MNEERLLILKMVAEGKISVEQADRLIAALEGERPGINGKQAVTSAYDVLSRAMQEMQKGFQTFGTRAEDELRRFEKTFKERQASLRVRLEEVLKNRTVVTKEVDPNDGEGAKRDHTITIEVEEEDAPASDATTSGDESPRNSGEGASNDSK